MNLVSDVKMNNICISICLLLCLSLCTGNQEIVQDKEETGREDVESQDQDKPAGHTQLSGFSVDDSSWKIVWHASSDADFLVCIYFSFMFYDNEIILPNAYIE